MRVRTWEDDDNNGYIMDPSGLLDDPDYSFNDLPEYDMALVKKSTEKQTPADKPAKVTKAPKVAADKPKRVFGPRVVPEGFVGLAALAAEFDLKPAVIRRRLRTAEGLTKPEGQHGWYWKDGSKDLAAVRKALTVK